MDESLYIQLMTGDSEDRFKFLTQLPVMRA